MPASPFTTWPLIALLLAAPAAAQDTTTDEAPSLGATDPETPPPDAPSAETTAPQAPDAQTDAAPAAPATEPDGQADAATQPPGDAGSGLSLGDEGQPQVGEVYTRDAFTDWELRCERAEEGEDPCQLYQLLQDQNDNSVAEISVFALPEGSDAAAGATIVTPLETLLTEQIVMSVDGGPAKRYPFSFCTGIGCIARVGFTGAEVQSFRGGNTATLTITPAAAPDQEVTLTVSLSGFTAGFDAVRESGPAGQ